MNNNKRWMIATTEGFTVAPDNSTWDNLQILGIVEAETSEDAVKFLKKEYPDVTASFDEVCVYEVADLNPDTHYLKEA